MRYVYNWNFRNADFYPLRHLLPSLLASIVALVETQLVERNRFPQRSRMVRDPSGGR